MSRWAKERGPEPRAFGKTAAELAKGAWFDALVGRPELALDSDGDGLTEIEEARLETDPKKADTDGDGDPDGVDPCPNAAPRPQGDDERVLAAAFEARNHFRAYSHGSLVAFTTPAVLHVPKGMKPFEFVGWNGPLLWHPEDAGFVSPLERCYGQGVGLLSFGRDPAKPPVEWNADRTQATVRLSTYFGGLNGDGYLAVVRKFGEEWVVVEMRMEYVS